MKKFKKAAFAAVSLALAGTMALSFAACGDTSDNGGTTGGDDEEAVINRGKRSTTISSTVYNSSDTTTVTVGGLQLTVKKDASGNATNQLAYTTGTTLNMNICDSSNNDRHITYHSSQISASAVMPDGYTYMADDLKPAWWQLSQTLGVKFVDKAQNRSSEKQVTEMIQNKEQANYNIVTGSGSAITNNADTFLDLNQYLDYMPNYKAFLDENPIVRWSLTTDTSTGAMYYAPYFDGNNDIEKYVLTHREWTRALLDSSDVSKATTTWAESKSGKSDVGTEQTYATAFMGQTGSWQVDATDPSDDSKLVKVVVNYDAAKTAAASESTALGAAYKAAAGAVYGGESGNIVDIMNAAIAAKSGAVTGAQLIGILRAYIDVAYQTTSGAKFYSTRSDVFNSVSAAWDADLMTALYRCVVTSYKLFGLADATTANQIYGLAARQGTTQRRYDLECFAGELYGARGMESRNEYAYVDANGDLKDARTDEASYDAMDRLSDLAKEGLVYTGTATVVKYRKDGDSILPFMMHDYSQTQSTDGFYVDVEGLKSKAPSGLITSGDLKFDFAPILTPVSNWDTNSDGTAETIMRFTESWRAVKNTGFAVPKASVTNAETLSATLAFIDYLFSNDGQLVATFGPMSTVGNTKNADGFWYGTKVGEILNSDGTVNSAYKDKVETYDGIQYVVKTAYKSQYFAYNNVLYTGTEYLGTQIPTLTSNNLNYFYGLTVNGHYLGEGDAKNAGIGYIGSVATNYTNYARGVVGGALPIGNKNQGFEYQATASCALDGAAVVSKALTNGAIKHLTQTVSADTYWYTCVPTTLPVNSTDASTLKAQGNLTGSDSTAGLYLNTSKTVYTTNLYIDLILYGYGANKNVASNDKFGSTLPIDAASCITLADGSDFGIRTRTAIYAKGWDALKAYYNV